MLWAAKEVRPEEVYQVLYRRRIVAGDVKKKKQRKAEKKKQQQAKGTADGL